MSKLFCVSPGLRVLERQMQQPPGYRPRGYNKAFIMYNSNFFIKWNNNGNTKLFTSRY